LSRERVGSAEERAYGDLASVVVDRRRSIRDLSALVIQNRDVRGYSRDEGLNELVEKRDFESLSLRGSCRTPVFAQHQARHRFDVHVTPNDVVDDDVGPGRILANGVTLTTNHGEELGRRGAYEVLSILYIRRRSDRTERCS
jgi:hypothetical protein